MTAMRALRLAEQSTGLSRQQPCVPERAASLDCTTALVDVRPLAEADARTCWTLMVERAAGRRGWRAPPGLADIRRRIAALAAAHEAGSGLGLAVCARGDGRLLGWLELARDGQADGSASLRPWFAPAAEAAMMDGVLAALPAALRFLDADALTARIEADDEPALRLVRRLGLKPSRRPAGPGFLLFQRDLAGIL